MIIRKLHVYDLLNNFIEDIDLTIINGKWIKCPMCEIELRIGALCKCGKKYCRYYK